MNGAQISPPSMLKNTNRSTATSLMPIAIGPTVQMP